MVFSQSLERDDLRQPRPLETQQLRSELRAIAWPRNVPTIARHVFSLGGFALQPRLPRPVDERLEVFNVPFRRVPLVHRVALRLADC